MKDIENAMRIEKEYQEYVLKGEHPYHLVDRIIECGFDTLDEYYVCKKEFDFNQLIFLYEECNPENCLTNVFRTIKNREIKFLWMISDSTFVFSGNDTVNYDYCNKNNIPVYDIKTGGGTIVSTAGDVSLCICVPKSMGIDSNFILDRIASILGENAKVDGNDILIDGYKVLGSAKYEENDMFAWVAHASFNDDSDIISNICRIPKSGKVPSYIKNMMPAEFGLEVAKWLRVQSI